MQRSVNNASFRCATRCNNKCEGFKYIPGCRNTITVELCVSVYGSNSSLIPLYKKKSSHIKNFTASNQFKYSIPIK